MQFQDKCQKYREVHIVASPLHVHCIGLTILKYYILYWLHWLYYITFIYCIILVTVRCSRNIEHGQLTSSNEYQATLEYTCNVRYNKGERRHSTCLPSGVWSREPICDDGKNTNIQAVHECHAAL